MEKLLLPVLALGLVFGTAGCWGSSSDGQCAEESMSPGQECDDVGIGE
ncbi:hypothetical protein [Arthrobacter sp.]